MNYKLSVYTNRVAGRSGFTISCNGDTEKVSVTPLLSNNIKEDILKKLAKGLRFCRGYVSHEDILYIEIQNQHLCSWLDGKQEYKDYCTFLDEVFEVLESLDCRYKFMFVKEPFAKARIDNDPFDTIKGSSVADVFADMP